MTRTGTVTFVEGESPTPEGLLRLVLSAGYTLARFDSAAAYLGAGQPPRGEDRAGHARCLLVDAGAPRAAGMDVARFVECFGADAPVVFLAAQPDVRAAVRAMKAGAMDYLAIPVRDVDLLAAVAAAIAQSAADLALRLRHESARARVARLTVRERQVFELVLAGRLNKQIADALGSQVATVKVHRSRLMHKLEVRSLVELLALGRELQPPHPFAWERPPAALSPEPPRPRPARSAPARAAEWGVAPPALAPAAAVNPG